MFSSCQRGFPVDSWVSTTFQNMPVSWAGYSKFLLGVNKGVSMCVHGAFLWTGFPSRVYSFISGDPDPPRTLARMKRLLKNESHWGWKHLILPNIFIPSDFHSSVN